MQVKAIKKNGLPFARSWKAYALLFLYSAFISVCTGIAAFIATFKWFPIRETLRAFSVDLIVFAVLLLLPAKAARIAIIALFGIFLPLSLASVLHVAIYHSAVSPFSVMSTLETSANEATEFLDEFVTAPNAAIAAATILLAVLFLLGSLQANAKIERKKRTVVIAALILCGCGYFLNSNGQRLAASNVNYVIIHSIINHQRDVQLVQDIRKTRAGQHYDGITLLDAAPAAQKTYIFIIGESSNRNHMSLYGYPRPTNPELEKLAPQLEVFTDAISSSTHTIPSLRQSLFFNQKNGDDSGTTLNHPSIIGLLRRAGFETWWLSNQTANSDGLTGTAVFAGDAAHRLFLNKARSEGHSASHDEVLVAALEKVLQNEAPQKAIFVHLLGSHLSYHLRYPDQFDFFQSTDDIPDAPHVGDNEKKYINEYDNSIRYTDHIVSEIISLMQKREEVSFVVYFSDHGQEVYDTLPIRGQDAKQSTRHMFDVPFILWLSENYRLTNPQTVEIIQSRRHAPFSLDRFADTAADLSRLTFTGSNPGHSLFAPDYIPPSRRGIPYGKFYENLPNVSLIAP